MQCFLSQSWLITCAIYTVTWWQPSIICGLSFNLNQERWGLSDWSFRKRRGRTSIYPKAWAPFLRTLRNFNDTGPNCSSNIFLLLCSLLLVLHHICAFLFCECASEMAAMLNITFTPTMKPCAVVFCFFFCKQKKLFDFHCCCWARTIIETGLKIIAMLILGMLFLVRTCKFKKLFQKSFFHFSFGGLLNQSLRLKF